MSIPAGHIVDTTCLYRYECSCIMYRHTLCNVSVQYKRLSPSSILSNNQLLLLPLLEVKKWTHPSHPSVECTLKATLCSEAATSVEEVYSRFTARGRRRKLFLYRPPRIFADIVRSFIVTKLFIKMMMKSVCYALPIVMPHSLLHSLLKYTHSELTGID